MRQKLKSVFENKDWSEGGSGPKSGYGSSLAHTEQLRTALPGLFSRHGVRRFVDAPCGDWHWMSQVNLTGIDYIGIEISEGLVALNRAEHARPGVSFKLGDVTSDPLPEADLLMCRDCLFHLKFWLRWEFFQNFLASGTPLLLTTFHHVERNRRLGENGGFTKFNPMLPPFDFAEPIEVIHETVRIGDDGELHLAGGRGGNRSLGLWTRNQVQGAVDRHLANQNEDRAEGPQSNVSSAAAGRK